MGSKIMKNINSSNPNCFTIYAKGDNSYKTISNLIRKDIHITQLWVSNFQCFAIDINNSLLSWGLNNYYQLGNGKYMDYVFNQNNKEQSHDTFNYISWENTNSFLPNILSKPCSFPFLAKEVRHIECGDGFSFFLLKTGTLYSVGRNDKGQLGIDLPFANAKIISCKKCLDKVSEVEYFKDNHLLVKDIKCGSDFCFALCNDGNYYSWGNNDHFQLCRETLNTFTPHPEKVKAFNEHNNIRSNQIEQLCLGWMHGVILTNNSIYIWGNPYFDYDNKYTDIKVPQLVINEDNNTIVRLQSGFHHVAYMTVINKKYVLKTFGANDFGQLGYDSKDSVITHPKVVNVSDNKQEIKEVYCGAFHTMLLLDNNEIWGFGQNDNGQIGDYNSEYVSWPVKYNWKTDENLTLHKIICANASTVVIKKNQNVNDSAFISSDDNEEVLIN